MTKLDSETIAVIKETWECIITAPDYEECIGEQLIYNYIHLNSSVLDVAPFYDDSLEDGFDREKLRLSAIYIMKCMNAVITIIGKHRHLKFKSLIQCFKSRLVKYRIFPMNMDKAIDALLMTVYDVLQDGFTDHIRHHWICFIKVAHALIWQ